MTAVMLATYPDVFAGGAVIAGLPFGTAQTVPEAFERMRGQATSGPDRLAGLVRSASKHAGPWPILSVWHGRSDQTVDVSNAAALINQWRGLHGVAAASAMTERVAGRTRRTWCNRDGQEVIEEHLIDNMGHGTPIQAAAANHGEAAGPYMLDVGISSTRRIVAFWKLDRTTNAPRVATPRSQIAAIKVHPQPAPEPDSSAPSPAAFANRVQEVIEKALRSAGLMR